LKTTYEHVIRCFHKFSQTMSQVLISRQAPINKSTKQTLRDGGLIQKR